MGEPFYSLDGPLDARPAHLQMRAANFAGLPLLVRDLGGDPRAILERHGLDARAVRDPDYFIECRSLIDVLEHCSHALDEPLFGVRLAEMQEPEVYGCVTALCRAASTVRNSIESMIGYIPVVHSPATQMELVEAGDTAELRWDVSQEIGANDQANLQATMLNIKLWRAVAGRSFRPTYVNLTTKVRSKDVATLEDVLGCRYVGGAAINAIAFPRALLDQPVATSNRLLYRLLGGYLDRVKAASRTTVVERVEDYVRGALPTGVCSIEHCAKRFGASVRTLQAQLSEHGLRFSDILEQQRVELAKIYLRQNELSLDEIAAMLGYSEQSSFGRAFKRWTGATPHRYRAVHAGPVLN